MDLRLILSLYNTITMSQLQSLFQWKNVYDTLKILLLTCFITVALYFVYPVVTQYAVKAFPVLSQGQEYVSKIPAEIVQALSTSTPKRVINMLTIRDVVPAEGKFVGADLVEMKLYTYEDGVIVDTFPIESKGRPGTAWETPSGMYTILLKKENHFSSIGKVYMPYSMQFYGNYFIHGWTYYPDGTPTSTSFSGGCIKLNTENAKKVFEFVDVGTKVFVFDSKQTIPKKPLTISEPKKAPYLSAQAYLVADIDTGDVLLEKNAQEIRPIASITKLMTALVTNETISFDKNIYVTQGAITHPANFEDTEEKIFVVGDLLYPLLMQSSNSVADTLSSYYGKGNFMRWMNTTALSLNMASTTFADPSGISSQNISTADDLFRFLTYIFNKKPFILNITHNTNKKITAVDGTEYTIISANRPADTDPFIGGKSGHTTAAQDTMAAILSFDVDEESRNVAVIILGSQDRISDMNSISQWVTQVVKKDIDTVHTEEHRKIEL